MTATSASSAPPRGTRPRNRRALIVAAATQLFHEVGYPNVSMGDIAESVNVQPSALYRHFASKNELLVAAVRGALEPTHDAVATGGDDLSDVLRGLARTALSHRGAGVLWHREARYLPDEDRQRLRRELSASGKTLTGRIQQHRPDLTHAQADLLAWSAFACIASVSFHHLQLPSAQFEGLLYEMLEQVVNAPVPALDNGAPPPSKGGLALRSRREVIVNAAARLFTTRGFASITIDDIGEAAGIAGPSLYTYFASKQDLLVAIVNRVNEWLWVETARAVVGAFDERDALRRMLASYTQLALEHREIVTVLVGDQDQVAEPDRHRARQAQHDFITEWVELLRPLQPELDATAARVRVHAALMIVNDATLTPHLLQFPGLGSAVRSVAGSLLSL